MSLVDPESPEFHMILFQGPFRKYNKINNQMPKNCDATSLSYFTEIEC